MEKGWLHSIKGIIIGATILLIASQVVESIGFTNQDVEEEEEYTVTEAYTKGQKLSHGNCTDTGTRVLTHSPMEYGDFAFIIPYGLVVDSHVTPIDHQYFSPTDWNSPRDAYPVYAMADGVIVDIQHRLNPPHKDEYRVVMSHTCTFFTYFDLVTSLTPKLEETFNRVQNNNYAVMDYPVKAGELVGYIGGQTLDFAVWNTEHTLTGFTTPSNYDVEMWKIHTDDPYKYYSEELLPTMISKNLRTVEPIGGKIDHDIPGTIVGNWFLENSRGYAGNDTGNYWDGHLSIALNHVDPTGYMFSIGNYDGQPAQFSLSRSELSPKEIGIDSGVVKYTLYDTVYITPQGDYWDRNSLV